MFAQNYFASRDAFPGQNVTLATISGIPYEQCLIPEVASLASKFQVVYDLCSSIPGELRLQIYDWFKVFIALCCSDNARFFTALFVIGFWGKLRYTITQL